MSTKWNIFLIKLRAFNLHFLSFCKLKFFAKRKNVATIFETLVIPWHFLHDAYSQVGSQTAGRGSNLAWGILLVNVLSSWFSGFVWFILSYRCSNWPLKNLSKLTPFAGGPRDLPHKFHLYLIIIIFISWNRQE